MAILKSTQVKGDLSVTGNLNVQGDLTYVGVNNLRVKDHQIELNANDSGSASLAGADQAGIVIRGAQNTEKDPNSKEASILYNHGNDSLVINKTIEGTVTSANNAASADKVANTLTINVERKAGSEEVVFDGSAAKTVSIDLKALQDQIDGMSGDVSSIATQISNAINDLNSNVTAEATGTAAKDGVFVLQGVTIDEKAGKLTSATPSAVEVEKAGAAAQALVDAKSYADGLASNYDAKGAAAQALVDAKSYADGLNTAMDGRVQTLESASHAHDNKAELDKIVSGDVAKWNAKQNALNTNQLAAVNSGITKARVDSYEAHVANDDIHVTAGDKAKWNAAEDNAKAYADGLAKNYDAAGAAATAETNAKKYTDDEIKKLGLGTAAKKNVLTVAIADSSSDDLVTAAQVKAYAAGVVGAMHFRGAVDSTDVITDPASGDICLVGTKEYVYDGQNWVLFGDEGAYDTKGSADKALENAKKYADGLNTEMDKRVDALEAIDHNAYKAADATTLASAKSYADGLAKNYATADHNHDTVYSKLGHTHAITDVTGLQDALDGKAASSHTHAIADVNGLQGALDAKQGKLTETQLNAVNSGITATKVSGYDSHVADTTKHVSDSERTAWNAAEQNAKDYADGKVAALNNTVVSLSADVLKGVAAGDYVSVSTKSSNSQTISVTTQGVASASDTKNGLALAADVKKYVDGKNADQDTKIANIENGTTLDGRYVNVSGDTMTGKLTMNAADIEMPSNGTNGIVFGGMKIVWKDNAIEFIPTTA